MAWLREQPNFRRYATFWRQLLWGWGGFYLDDREEQEFEWMSKYSGIPAGEIPTALEAFEAFDRFFPIPDGWFITAGRRAFAWSSWCHGSSRGSAPIIAVSSTTWMIGATSPR